ncbi:MAG: glycerol-3-phosphate dehydrogenase C-terminal domain-containing protein, partial [Gluconacetobacter sp.]
LGPGGFDSAVARLRAHAPFLSADDAWRLVRNYGTLAWEIVGTARNRADLGEDFGGGLTAREVDYLVAQEWAVTAEDILWRRSRQGLHIDGAGQARLERYLDARREAVRDSRSAMAG